MLGDHDVGAWFRDSDGNILALVNQPSGPQ